ncbi:MAG TPA: heme-binding domain-containing protein [Candidatus Sulfotelmatobacter sp.]|nr:heme-binding domain-containing protein [Candidatus Sulfotelmatobacter sp.]
MKRILKWGIPALIVLFAALQIVQPSRTNPPVKSDFLKVTAAPPDVAAMFHAACYDCHSDETRWPWYSYVAPMSWQVARDVNDGRRHVNLSEWPENPDLARKKIDNMSDEIDDGDMPLKKYTLIHRDARLTSEQRDTLTQWLDAQASALKSQGDK